MSIMLSDKRKTLFHTKRWCNRNFLYFLLNQRNLSLQIIYQCGTIFWHIAFASAVVLPNVFFIKLVHSFLVSNKECHASTDSTEKLTIVPADATIASTIIMVCNWFIGLIGNSQYIYNFHGQKFYFSFMQTW